MTMEISLLYIILFIVCIYTVGMSVAFYEKKVCLLVALSVFYFFGEYIVFSALLFWLDVFSILKVLLITLIYNIICLILLVCKHKQLPRELHFDLTPMLAVALIIAFILTMNPFGYFGMGQDQGVYQVKAIDLMYGSTERVKDFDEYHSLNEGEKKEYYNTVKTILGYNITDISDGSLLDMEKASDVSGIYHGIPTYPAILALSGMMFGIECMATFNVVFFLIFLIFVYYICKNLKLDKLNIILVLTIVLLSPINIWVSKSTLTELFLMILMAVFIYYLTVTETKKNILLSVVPICIYAFYHVTLYTLLPLFFVMYFILYILTNNKTYLLADIIINVIFIIGLFFMTYVSPEYTALNIVRPFSRITTVINNDNYIWVLIGIVLFFTIIEIIFEKKEAWRNFLAIVLKTKQFNICLKLLLVLFFFFSGAHCINDIVGADLNIYETTIKNTLVAYALLTGIIVLPIVGIIAFVYTERFLKNKKLIVILIMFFYCILFHSTVLRTEIPHYYYYSRYLAPFIIIIALMVGVLIKRRLLLCSILIIVISVLAPYSVVMYDNKDDTHMEWETLIDVCEKVKADDAVVISDSLILPFMIPITEITSADVYPEMGLVGQQIKDLSEKYTDVFFLTKSSVYQCSNDFRLIYSDTVHESYDNQISYRFEKMPFPYDFKKNDYAIYLYKYNEISDCYKFDINFDKCIGFDKVEDGFVWTNEIESQIQLELEQGEYYIVLEIIHEPPYQALNISEYFVDIYINDSKYLKIDLNNVGKNIIIALDENDTKDGFVTLKFQANLWSPSSYGEDDTRNLGFAIGGVYLLPSGNQLNYSHDNMGGYGFFNVEQNKFAWSNSSQATATCVLLPDDYVATVHFAPYLPLNEMDIDRYEVQVYFNEEYVGTAELDGTTQANEYVFTVSAGTVKKGENIIRFESKLWSPADYGSTDTRELGFPLENIIFERQ